MILIELLSEMTEADISWIQRNIDSLIKKRDELVANHKNCQQVDRLLTKHRAALAAIQTLFDDPDEKALLQTVKK